MRQVKLIKSEFMIIGYSLTAQETFLMLFVFAGSLQSVWLHVTFTKRWWGKNQDFMLIRLLNANDLIGCGGDN